MRVSQKNSITTLYNVPPPSQEDTVAFKEFASKQAPPASFFELQQDCIRSAKMAIKDGYPLVEVEFPPLPAKVLELDDVSAYDVSQANLKLALEFSKGFSTDGKNVAVLFPDESEAAIAVERLTGKDDVGTFRAVEVEAGITVSSLRRSEEGDDRIFKVSKACIFFFNFNCEINLEPIDQQIILARPLLAINLNMFCFFSLTAVAGTNVFEFVFGWKKWYREAPTEYRYVCLRRCECTRVA